MPYMIKFPSPPSPARDSSSSAVKRPRSILALFMASLMEELDYGNFKATLPSSDRLRLGAYYKCWKAMDEWQKWIAKRQRVNQ